MAEASGRDRLLVAFLRQMSGGFSSYRLFAGNVHQAGFMEAAARVRSAAESLLSGGPVRIRVHGDGFLSEEGPLPQDDNYRRLALACYERRVEEMTVLHAPTRVDLVALYAVLSTPVDEMDEGGGAPAMLTRRGVESIRLNEAQVSATTGPQAAEGFIPVDDPLFQGIERLDRVSSELLGDPGTGDATAIYGLLREVVAALPSGRVDDPDTYQRLRDAIDRLPEEVRTNLASILLSDVGVEPVAERLIGTMTDSSLAEMLLSVARLSGADPLELARELVVGGFRRYDLIELAETAVGSAARGGFPGGIQGDRAGLLTAVGELVEGTTDVEAREDVASIRKEFPRTEEELFQGSLRTFSDYLRVEDDEERLASVLETWAEATRAALDRDEIALATTFVEVCDRAEREMRAEHPDGADVLVAAKATVLDQSLIETLTQHGSTEAAQLLSMFGDAAVDGLLTRLAAEEVSARRSTLIAVVAGLVPQHHDLLARWAKDDRWFVVRNVMTILQRAGSGASMLGVVEIGLRHPHPTVRREAVRALAQAGPAALNRLAPLAADPDRDVALAAVDALGSVALAAVETGPRVLGEVVLSTHDAEARRRSLELLAKHPSPEAVRVLSSIASLGSRPRAPFTTRRRAKALLRQRRAGR